MLRNTQEFRLLTEKAKKEFAAYTAAAEKFKKSKMTSKDWEEFQNELYPLMETLPLKLDPVLNTQTQINTSVEELRSLATNKECRAADWLQRYENLKALCQKSEMDLTFTVLLMSLAGKALSDNFSELSSKISDTSVLASFGKYQKEWNESVPLIEENLELMRTNQNENIKEMMSGLEKTAEQKRKEVPTPDPKACCVIL